MNSDISLLRKYNKFNKKFFNDELPSDVEIFYAPVPAYATCEQLEDGTFVIKISPSVAAWILFVNLTLVHEMVHVKCGPKHDAKFDREIQRLCGFKEIRKWI